ncbi:MAG: hypothetical protein NTX50_10690 [Candidatus Sumerlaeota bacterium]|nr:hypothetical protein [Candidatus Sumerlaeota bacterium]
MFIDEQKGDMKSLTPHKAREGNTMKTRTEIYEGTWEDILKHASKFSRRQVRLTVLPGKNQRAISMPGIKPKDKATEEFLNQFFGAWVGDSAKRTKQVPVARSKSRS